MKTEQYKAWQQQKGNAQRRGIDFNITYEEFCNFWGNDFNKRGIGVNKLQMCRYKDQGPYEIGNVYKDTHYNNLQTQGTSVLCNGNEYENIYAAARGEGIHFNTWYLRYNRGVKGYEYI